MKKALTIILIFASCCLNAADKHSEGKVIRGFSGGMMVHTGYMFGSDYPHAPLSISNATFGIGGVVKLHFTDHFRAGFEGYFSSAPLTDGMDSGSYNKMCWTGALVEWYWKFGRIYPYIGTTVGGGTETSFYLFDGDKHSWEPKDNVIFHKQPFFAVDPYIGVEYKVSNALRLTLKADWLIAVNSDGLNKPTGPRIYFGFIFAH